MQTAAQIVFCGGIGACLTKSRLLKSIVMRVKSEGLRPHIISAIFVFMSGFRGTGGGGLAGPGY